MDPIQIFREWFSREQQISKLRIPTACCLSTIGLDGYPNARFVSLKEVSEGKFIICGPLDSRKGMEIAQTNKLALSFWWTETERQVRIQGDAEPIPAHLADTYFGERDRDSRIVSFISEQGRPLDDPALLQERFDECRRDTDHRDTKFSVSADMERPENWGGWAINPVRIEFMQFRPNRLHERQLFTLNDGIWEMMYLQP